MSWLELDNPNKTKISIHIHGIVGVVDNKGSEINENTVIVTDSNNFAVSNPYTDVMRKIRFVSNEHQLVVVSEDVEQ